MAEQQQMKFRIVDNPNVTESYANRLVSAAFDGSAIAVTMGAARFTPEILGEAAKDSPPPTLHVTARLTLSPTAAVDLIKALNQILSSVARPNPAPAAAPSAPN